MITEDGTMNETTNMIKYKSVGGFEPKTNVLGLVVFSCFFGAIIGRMGNKGEPLRIFFDAFMEAVMQLVTLIIW